MVARWLWRSGVVYLLTITAVIATMWIFYRQTTVPVMLVLDGEPIPLRTHQTTVDALLNELGLQIVPRDVVVPPRDTRIEGGEVVSVQRARPYIIEADGKLMRVNSHAYEVLSLLYEAGIEVGPYDRILVNGLPTDVSQPVPSAVEDAQPGAVESITGQLWRQMPPRAAQKRVTVRRAVPLYIHDGVLQGQIYTTETTIGAALLDQGIVLYLGDRVSPSLGTRVSAGLHVYVRRSMPVEIWVDSRRIRTRTQAGTVGELLTQVGIALIGKDRVEPAETTPIAENTLIEITRVREEIEEEEELIPFETVWQPDPELEIDEQRLQQAGEEGLTKRRFRVQYENGQEITRALEDEWLDRDPQTKTINYGTRIVVRQLETSEGSVEYWRRIRVLATSYTAATSGKERDHPHYGITFLGWQMRGGIVAVDPTVVGLRSPMYVPGYGQGVAGDTGGAIKGRRIDLGYEEDELVLWYKWVDVYLLAPAPPRDQIRWVLPNWPREK